MIVRDESLRGKDLAVDLECSFVFFNGADLFGYFSESTRTTKLYDVGRWVQYQGKSESYNSPNNSGRDFYPHH